MGTALWKQSTVNYNLYNCNVFIIPVIVGFISVAYIKDKSLTIYSLLISKYLAFLAFPKPLPIKKLQYNCSKQLSDTIFAGKIAQ
jgi:hypothetical protein